MKHKIKPFKLRGGRQKSKRYVSPYKLETHVINLYYILIIHLTLYILLQNSLILQVIGCMGIIIYYDTINKWVLIYLTNNTPVLISLSRFDLKPNTLTLTKYDEELCKFDLLLLINCDQFRRSFYCFKIGDMITNV